MLRSLNTARTRSAVRTAAGRTAPGLADVVDLAAWRAARTASVAPLRITPELLAALAAVEPDTEPRQV